MIYPLIDVFVYSFEEGYNSASQTFYGVGMYNYSYVLHDPYFLQALKNTFILVIITVPVSTGLALLISAALSSIKPLRDLFQTIFFLPYVTNTLAVGLVFMILFKKTPYSDGLINLLIQFFGGSSVDFIDGPYWAKMFVLCFYTIWIVMPFKILILTSALASVNPMYYNAARVDGTSRFRMFTKITLPMISPMVFYLIITGFIGAFKAYSDAVALFGTNLNAAEMNTIVGYVYDMLYGDSGGYPSYASAAAILLFAIVLTITCINLFGQQKACPLCIGKEVFVMSDVTSDYEKIEKRTRIRGNIRNGIVYFFLCLWALIVLFPFYWMVLTSVKSYGSYNAEYIPKFFTLSPTLQNYVDAFTTVSLGRYLWNTLFFTVVTTAIIFGGHHPGGLRICKVELCRKRSDLYVIFISDDDSQRAGGHYEFHHHHEPGSAQYLHRPDPAFRDQRILYLSAAGEFRTDSGRAVLCRQGGRDFRSAVSA